MYSGMLNEYITDVQYFEGFVGAFGNVISFVYLRRFLKLKNISVVIGLSFLITWILRKSLMNIYIKLKNDKENKYNVNILNNEIKGVNMYILFIILMTSLLVYNISLKNISHVSKLVYLFFIVFFYMFVKE